MTDFRINSYKIFEEISNPSFGPELKIDFNDYIDVKYLNDKKVVKKLTKEQKELKNMILVT